MGYTISIRKRLICKDLPLDQAIEYLKSEIEDIPENEEMTGINIWNEGD